jgi:hypothetical protein
MTKLTFTKEPVAYIGLAILILQILQAIYKGQPLEGFSDSLLTIGGTIITRQLVTPAIGKTKRQFEMDPVEETDPHA